MPWSVRVHLPQEFAKSSEVGVLGTLVDGGSRRGIGSGHNYGCWVGVGIGGIGFVGLLFSFAQWCALTIDVVVGPWIVLIGLEERAIHRVLAVARLVGVRLHIESKEPVVNILVGDNGHQRAAASDSSLIVAVGALVAV